MLLVNVVDKRLNNIVINVPKQNLTVNMSTDDILSKNVLSKNNNNNVIEGFEPHIFSDNNQKVENIQTDEHSDKFRDVRLRPDLFNSTLPSPNVCQMNHIHKGCNYGTTNYNDPSEFLFQVLQHFWDL